MTDQTEGLSKGQNQFGELALCVGICITAWSNVEFHLAMLFRWAIGCHPVIADAVFATPRNFEVRSTMLHNVMRLRLKETPALDDWNLLYNYACKMGGRRNEIAHATALQVEGEEPALEPYFVISQKKSHIPIAEVQRRTTEFQHLEIALMWFANQLQPELPQAPATPIPDLLLRLRAEDAQKREAQRAQQKQPRP